MLLNSYNNFNHIRYTDIFTFSNTQIYLHLVKHMPLFNFASYY